MRYLQWKHINDILDHPLEESYQTKVIENFKWEDWIDPTMVMPKHVKRSDMHYKDFPYRARPITGPQG